MPETEINVTRIHRFQPSETPQVIAFKRLIVSGYKLHFFGGRQTHTAMSLLNYTTVTLSLLLLTYLSLSLVTCNSLS